MCRGRSGDGRPGGRRPLNGRGAQRRRAGSRSACVDRRLSSEPASCRGLGHSGSETRPTARPTVGDATEDDRKPRRS